MRHRVAGAAIGLVVLTLVGKAIGLARELVIAGSFGAGAEFDAYLVGAAVPDILSLVAYYVALYLFVPLYLEERERSAESADRFAAAFLLRSSLVLLCLGAGLAAVARTLVMTVAPGLDPAYAGTAVASLRVLSLILILRGLEGGFRGLAHADGRFWLPTFGTFLSSLIIIALLVLASGRYGVIVLAVAVTLGALAPALVTAIPLLRRHPDARRFAWSHPLLARCAERLPWIVAIEACGLLRPLVDRAIAGRLLEDGAISALAYGGVLSEVPFQVLGLTVATLLLPEFSRLHARGDREGGRRMLRRGIGVGVTLMLPFAVLFLVLREPTVRAMYQRGEFDAEATRLTARALWPLAAGLPAMAVAGVTMQAAYASGRLRALLLVRVAALLVKIASSLALVGAMGHAGLAMGTTLFNVTVAVGLVIVLLGRTALVHRPAWVAAGTIASGAMGWGTYAAAGAFGLVSAWGGIPAAGLAWLVGLAAFAAVCRLGRVEEVLWLQGVLFSAWFPSRHKRAE